MGEKGFMTIGYGNMNIRNFIATIKALRINCIIDVRTRPYSKYNVSFNKEELRDRLNDEGISYFWLGNKLGGRYDKIKFCDELGRVDYEKVATSEKFIEGIKELEDYIAKYNVCVMCSEMDPMKCHRFLLISRALKKYNIYHILNDGNLVKNSDMEKMLFDMYGCYTQLSFFDDFDNIESRAYREHGLKTAYVSIKVKDLLSQGATEDLPDTIKVYCIGSEEKTAEQFFELLKENKVKRIVDVRDYRELESVSFANAKDISYYLKLNCISYERLPQLIPTSELLSCKDNNSKAEFFRKYTKYILENNGILSLLTDELDGTCFLGTDGDYKNCHRKIIIKELKRKESSIRVRHLR